MFVVAIVEANMGVATSGSETAYPVLYAVWPLFIFFQVDYLNV